MKTNKTVTELREMLKETKGRIFSVSFIKKDGSQREMVARIGVKKYLKGGKLPFDPIEKGLLPVFDLKKEAYRMINLKTLQRVTCDGQTWNFTDNTDTNA